MQDKARKARAMAAFSTLAEDDKNLVLAVAEKLSDRSGAEIQEPPETAGLTSERVCETEEN